jgi:hypothetical protein
VSKQVGDFFQIFVGFSEKLNLRFGKIKKVSHFEADLF